MKPLIAAFIALFPLLLTAQTETYKNVDVKSENVRVSYKLFAAKPLSKENTYWEVFPEKLNNTPPPSIAALINPFISMEAKKVKPGQPAQYTFKYVTDGITNLTDDGNYYIDESGYVAKKLSYYKRLSYNCPFKVEVYNEQNQLIKTVVISNQEKIYYLQIDKNLLAPPPPLGSGPRPVVAFTSEEEANSFFTANKQKIAEYLEYHCLAETRDDIRRAIFSLYDYAKYQKDFVWFFTIEKKSQASFPDLFEKTVVLEQLLKDFDDTTKRAGAIKAMTEQYNLYTEKLQDPKSLPEDIKQMCRYNAALTAMFINKMDESQKWYTEFYNKFYLNVPFGISILPDLFANLYKYFYVYHAVQNQLNQPVIDVTHNIHVVHYTRFLADRKLTDTRMIAAKKAANPENTGYDEERNKKLLHATWLAYTCWGTGSNTEHLEPEDYIRKEGTTEIIGRRYLSASGPKKYFTVRLANTNGNIKEANWESNFGNFKVHYTWDLNKLAAIKIDGMSDYDYDFIYNEAQSDIIGMKAKKLINDEIQVVVKAQMNGDKIVRTTKWENKPKWKEEWMRSYKEINYTDSGIVVFCRTYFTGKANTDKNSSALTGIYRKSNGKSYVIVQPYGATTENSYNDNGDILHSLETKKNGINEHDYFYTGKTLYKEVLLEKDVNGALVQRTVSILDVPASLPASTPEYERKKGYYKFAPSGEMTWESNGTQYRAKVNGTWSEWKNFTM
jgi:hypothetical protein